MTSELQNRLPFERGPYLTMAVFCERVLHETDGVLSIIRVIDRLTHTEARADAPEQMPPVDWTMWLVVNLKAGEARGTVELRIEEEKPSGLRQQVFSNRLLMEGGDRGNNLTIQIQTKFTEEGLYWFPMYIDGVLVTKVPFRVVYARFQTGQPGDRGPLPQN